MSLNFWLFPVVNLAECADQIGIKLAKLRSGSAQVIQKNYCQILPVRGVCELEYVYLGDSRGIYKSFTDRWELPAAAFGDSAGPS